ncbi:hypothetical protein P389DRAFT_165050 [Cystobasidium minutum MCA 4210]|uniref:uncharacterized protein n=1 Tax=Cystobasidium minutum MCA 4210 TaxID=1397322 RepID=UPI0034CD9529|eukprot:jgi/Rhomi1/165050/fgenesh1_kg.1_\
MSELALAQGYIRDLDLVPHPEGGWFKLVHVSDDKIPSPYVKHDDRERSLCSVIYYLLAPEKLSLTGEDKPASLPAKHRNHAGYFHTNNSTTVHTWHGGKAIYTLIKIADTSANGGMNGHGTQHQQPEIKRVVVGDDDKAGETRVLVVGPGWWKRSQTLSPDGHCLISETVTPGWVPEDHTFMSSKDLQELFRDQHDLLTEFEAHVLPEGHELEFV